MLHKSYIVGFAIATNTRMNTIIRVFVATKSAIFLFMVH